MATPPGLSMNRRSNLPPPDACTSTSSYPRPATAGPLPEHHPVPAIGTRRGAFVRRRNARKRSPPIVKMDASRQLFKVFPAERTLNAHRIFALDLVARVHQTVGELAGIGEQQQARAV